MEFDRDLQSIQEVRNLIAAAKQAQEIYAQFNQEQVDRIVAEIARDGAAHAEELAKMAVEETGFGVWQDKILKNLLGSTLTYDYIKDMNEIYQLSDVYFFPVVEKGHCIDLPLSCLEAAACGVPIVTTDYGAMKEFVGKKGFVFIDSFENTDKLVRQALDMPTGVSRESVLDYDWSNAVRILSGI